MASEDTTQTANAAATENAAPQTAAAQQENTTNDISTESAQVIAGGETAADAATQTATVTTEREPNAPQTDADQPASADAAATGDDTGGETAPDAQTTGEQTGDAAAAETSGTIADAVIPAATPPGVMDAQPDADANDSDAQANGGEMDFGAMLEQFEQEQARFREGDLVQGRVINVSDRGVMVDFGYKSEGVAKIEEFMRGDETTVKVGDEVEAVIRRLDSGDGTAELSRAEAVRRRSWEELERAFNDETPVIGRVIDRIKGGLTVDVNGVEAFLPGSLIDSRPPRNLDVYKNKEIEARVIKFNRKRANVVLSRKALVDEQLEGQKAETFSQLGEGYIVSGQIKSLTEYGAFVGLGAIDGLLHVTDMSWSKLDKPSDMFKVGDEVQVKVLKFDRNKERVSLGLKQLQPDPWQSIEDRYEIGAKLRGKVSSVTDYGAFVELEPGVEGLVHVSEMSWSKRARHPNKIVKPGEEIDVQVLRVDPRDRRISLGMKQAMTNPWETIYSRYQVGDRVHGRVRNLTEFGAFVEIEEGVDGLVHVSDISHSKKIKHPGEVFKKNQEVDAIITYIDVEARRMSLSVKDLQPSAWEQFASTHRPGDVVKGKISRFANFGVFVELADELEGLCHISELSDERIDKPEKVYQIGQELDFKILRIESDTQKIGLSHRAVGKEDEPVVDTKSYSSEAKGGMASLGELANLRSLRGGEDK